MTYPETIDLVRVLGPSSVSPLAAAFARDVTGQAAPQGRERAKNLA